MKSDERINAESEWKKKAIGKYPKESRLLFTRVGEKKEDETRKKPNKKRISKVRMHV